MKKVTVIIPNFNGAELLKENLPFVVKAVIYSKSKGIDAYIIVVDDFSKDNSIDVVKRFQRQYDFIKLIINDKNLGFAKSVHIGIEKANSESIILLNSDVIVPENFIYKILEPFENDKVFAVSPIITDINKGVLSGSYKVPFLKKGELKYCKWKHLNFKKEKLLKTFFCEGGSVAISREKYFSIEGFDPIYEPFYFEDTDLCVKAWKRGWISYFFTEVEVIHNHKSTISKFFSKQYIKRIMRRNRFIFLWSNLPIKYLFFIHVPFILYRLIFYSIKFDFSYFLGFISALLSIMKIKKKREIEGCDSFFKIIEEINKDFNKII